MSPEVSEETGDSPSSAGSLGSGPATAEEAVDTSSCSFCRFAGGIGSGVSWPSSLNASDSSMDESGESGGDVAFAIVNC